MSAGSLKVLLLADSRSFHTERYAAELLRQGCDIMTASLESGTMPHQALKRRGPFRALHYALAVTEVRKLTGRFRPDIINPHFASGYGFLAALAERRHSVPILLHLWGSDILIAPHKSVFHKRKTRLALESADFVIGDSDYLLYEAEKIGRIDRRQKIAWGIERECLQYRRTGGKFAKPLKILVARPHEAVYNNLFIVRALADLVHAGRIELTFPEFGGMLGAFKRDVSGLISTGIAFYPKMPRREYLKFAARHDIYLSAARSDSSPASLLEALGLGLIPVAGDIPGVREWLSSDGGFLFDPANENSLREIVTQILTQDHDYDLMRQMNLAKIEKQAIFENNIAETIAIMRDLAGGNRR